MTKSELDAAWEGRKVQSSCTTWLESFGKRLFGEGSGEGETGVRVERSRQAAKVSTSQFPASPMLLVQHTHT